MLIAGQGAIFNDVVQPLKERIIRATGYGLLLEGESADTPVKASKGAAK